MAKDLHYQFGKYSLDTELLELRHNGEEQKVEPQILSLLIFLVENREHVVSKDALIENVWEGRIVSDATLNTRINGLRRAVGDTGQAQDVIRTFTKRGFRFVAELVTTPTDSNLELHPIVDDSGDSDESVTGTFADKPSIAVLPFDNMSGDPEQQYFSDGLTDDIISGLSRNGQLFVIARTSTISYGSKPGDVRQIGRELDVQYILEGSVRRSGERIRVSAQLIETSNGNHVWAQKFDRQMADIFDIQDEITENIGGAIGAEVQRAEIDKAAKRTDDLGAYEYALKAWWHLTHLTEESTQTSREFSQQAITRDGSYALAYSNLGTSYAYDAIFGWGGITRTESIEKSYAASSRAVELDANNEQARSSLAFTLLNKGEHQKAVRECEMALELNPNYHHGHFMLSYTLGYSGAEFLDRALQHMKITRRLAPHDHFLPAYMAGWSIIMTLNGRFDEAVELGQEAQILNQSLSIAMRAHASALALSGDLTQANKVYLEHIHAEPEFDWQSFKKSQYKSIKRRDACELYLQGLRLAGAPI